MNLNDFEDFLEFTKKMTTILKLKEAYYGDKWKTSSLSYLKNKLEYQRVKMDELFINLQNFSPPYNTTTNKIDLKNTLLDIANYCFFLYTRYTRLSE